LLSVEKVHSDHIEISDQVFKIVVRSMEDLHKFWVTEDTSKSVRLLLLSLASDDISKHKSVKEIVSFECRYLHKANDPTILFRPYRVKVFQIYP